MLGAFGGSLCRVVSGGPGCEVEGDWGGGAKEGDAGAERQGAETAWFEDRHAPDRRRGGVLAVAVAAVADGLFVAFADERGEVGEVAGVGAAAEDDLDDGGVPDCCGVVFAPAGAGLGEGLQDGDGGDAGAAAVAD